MNKRQRKKESKKQEQKILKLMEQAGIPKTGIYIDARRRMGENFSLQMFLRIERHFLREKWGDSDE